MGGRETGGRYHPARESRWTGLGEAAWVIRDAYVAAAEEPTHGDQGREKRGGGGEDLLSLTRSRKCAAEMRVEVEMPTDQMESGEGDATPLDHARARGMEARYTGRLPNERS